MSRMITPSSELRLPRSALASKLGLYPRSAAAARIRSRVSGRTGTPVSWPFRIREAVVIETPARSATSRSVMVPPARFATRSLPALDTADYRSRQAQTSRLIVKPAHGLRRPVPAIRVRRSRERRPATRPLRSGRSGAGGVTTAVATRPGTEHGFVTVFGRDLVAELPNFVHRPY